MQRAQGRDWYSVSVGTVWLVVLLVGGIVGGLGYFYWGKSSVERRAYAVFDQSTSLMQRLEGEEEIDSYRSELNQARQFLDQAEASLRRQSFDTARSQAEESLDLLEGIRSSLRRQGEGRVANFTRVEGDVRYRRGEKGEFRKAQVRDVLYEGDYVRSSRQGSAELYFEAEGTVFTVGSNALFKLTRRRGIGGKTESLGYMEYGWASLNTGKQTSGVTTRYAELRVEENSEATVSQPSNSKQTQFVVNRGRAKVKSSTTGEERQLEQRQQVVENGGRLGQTASIPSEPELLSPPDNYTLNIDREKRVHLSWEEVDGAVRYALQVSRSRRLFAENEIDVENRRGTSASLGVQEEGNYIWRVAAFGTNGLRGPWSSPRKFRAASFGGVELVTDETPPDLKVNVTQTGNVVIIQGRTEPGAKLELNGETISVKADGSFSTSTELRAQGLVDLVFRAVDEAGNPTVETRQVLIDEGF